MHQKRLLKLTSAQPGYRDLAAAPQGRKSSAVSAHVIQVHEVASVAPEKPAVQTFFQILQFIVVIHNHPTLLVEKLLSLGVILHLNEGESMAFTGKDTVEEAAKEIFRRTGSPVVITLGEKGALAYDGKEIFFAPPVKTSVVDTIGAGDSHAGAVISARRFGLSWQEAITAANYVSAAVVAKEGGQLEDGDFAKVLESLPRDLREKIGK